MAEWKRVGDTNVEVSDDGRVRRDGVEFVPWADGRYFRIWVDRKKQWLHRVVAMLFISNPEGKPKVDHLNGDTFDNRVSNLRWASHGENSYNSKPYSKKSDLPRGVSRNGKKFYAYINKEGKRYHLGTYDSAAEASEVYEATAMELFGEFYRPTYPTTS